MVSLAMSIHLYACHWIVIAALINSNQRIQDTSLINRDTVAVQSIDNLNVLQTVSAAILIPLSSTEHQSNALRKVSHLPFKLC